MTFRRSSVSWRVMVRPPQPLLSNASFSMMICEIRGYRSRLMYNILSMRFSGCRGLVGPGGLEVVACKPEGFAQRADLVLCLLKLRLRHAVGNNTGACLQIDPVILNNHCPNCDACVHVSGEVDVAYGTGVHAACFGLQFVDDFHRSHLGRAAYRARRKTRRKRMERIRSSNEAARNGRYDVHHVRIAFNKRIPFDVDRTGLANPTQDVSPQVHEHTHSVAFLRTHIDRAADRARRTTRRKSMERIRSINEAARNGRYDVHHVRIAFNKRIPFDVDRTGLANPPQVVSPQVNEHHMFGAFLRICEQFLFKTSILLRRRAAWPRTRDGQHLRPRTLRPDENLGRRSDQHAGICLYVEEVGGGINTP